MILHDTKGHRVILQPRGKQITGLADNDFVLPNNAAFVVKNDNDERVAVEVKYEGTTVFVPTKLDTGWNEDLIIAIKQNALVSNLLYSE